MLPLSEKWVPVLVAQPETGMGYQIASVVLRDGRQFDHVSIVGGIITAIADSKEIPFTEAQILEIRVTHDR